MPSPLAHIGLSLALAEAFRRGPWSPRDLLLLSISAVSPDFDVIPMLWDPNGIQWHHGPTHSLCGAALFGSFFALFSRRPGVVIAAALLHVPLDWATGEPGAPIRYGVPVFWPFSQQKYIAASPYFGAFSIDSPSGLSAMFSREAVWIYGKELATVLLAGGTVWAWKRLRPAAQTTIS